MSPKKVINRLSALGVSRKGLGMHLDGAGLYLQVTELGRSWVFRFKSPVTSKTRDMGLGPTHTISLAQARELAADARVLVYSGADPIAERQQSRDFSRLEASRAVIFKTAVEEYIKANRNSWKTTKHEKQWRSLMETYAYPTIGNLPVSKIEDEHIRQILHPVWHEKLETARRIRGHIEGVLERETHLKHRKGDNPARLGIITTALGKQVSRVRHMPALPYPEIGAFMDEIRARNGMAAMALELTILTAARTNEIIGAQWSEFNLAEAVWVIPAERMKVEREHRVPLSPGALAILETMVEFKVSNYVFPSSRKGKHISNMAMLTLLRRMERTDITVHGFRSSFRDWCAEQTNYAREVAESALAHVIADAVEAAYRRGDLFEKRRRLMNDWAKYCNTIRRNKSDKVVAIRG
jgi:integrase